MEKRHHRNKITYFIVILLLVMGLAPIITFAEEENETGTISVIGAAGTAGSTVAVKVEIKDNPGIIGLRLDVGYDSQYLSLTSVVVDSKLGESFNSPTYERVPYILYWNNGAFTQNITENGLIATLYFKIADNAPDGSYEITLSYGEYDILNADLLEVFFETENGSVDVFSFLFGDVNRDGSVNMLDATIFARWLAGWSNIAVFDEYAADLDQDGIVTPLDLTILQRHLAGWTGYESLPY